MPRFPRCCDFYTPPYSPRPHSRELRLIYFVSNIIFRAATTVFMPSRALRIPPRAFPCSSIAMCSMYPSPPGSCNPLPRGIPCFFYRWPLAPPWTYTPPVGCHVSSIAGCPCVELHALPGTIYPPGGVSCFPIVGGPSKRLQALALSGATKPPRT